MEIKKMNDLEYALHFDNSIQAKKLYHYLYKASVCCCDATDGVGCDLCELNNGCNGCCEYWKLIDALAEIAE